MRLVKTHGSLNEIFALDASPDAWASDARLREFVASVCDRSSWTGGSDGIYLYDASGPDARAWFFNPDGSSAEFCGNGMRGLGRLILDLRGTDTEVVNSGGRDYTVHRAPSTPEGVRQVLLELPPLRFDDAVLPAPFAGFTAVAVPNPHVIAVVDEYSEPDLIELGKRADEVFAAGANVSFLQPLDGAGDAAAEVFVRTFERGRGTDPVLRLRRGGVPGRLLPRVRPRPGAAPGRAQRRRGGRRLDPGPRRRLVPGPRGQRHGGLPRRGRLPGQPGGLAGVRPRTRTPPTRPSTSGTRRTSKATGSKQRTRKYAA